ncbi:MAG: YbaY family lipoprotein [Rhodanobacter sp.]
MRTTVLSLVSVAALALAGCHGSPSSDQAGNGSPAPAASAATAQIPSAVSGTISLREGTPQPSDKATLVLNLVDVSSSAAGTAPLATQTSPAGTFPQPFKLTFNPADVKPNDLYVVQANLTDGDRHYTMPIQAPVLAKGSKNDSVSIQLLAEQTPGEKLLADFKAEQAQLGAMKASHGTKLETDASRGWQLFRQDGQVHFIRELVEYTKNGFTSTDYAYKDGKPWFVMQQHKPSRDGQPTSIDRAGWSDDGTLVVKQHQVGSDVTPLDADAADKLKQEAMDILGIATKGKNK